MSERTQNGASLLAKVRDIAFIAGVALFFVGFVFNYFYYSALGISLRAADLTVNTVLVYAYDVVAGAWLWYALWLVVVLAATLGLRRLVAEQPSISGAVSIVGAIVVVLSFVQLSYVLSRQVAEGAVASIRSGQNTLPVRVTFGNTDRARNEPAALVKANEAGNLKLLAETDSALFIIDQPPLVDAPPQPPIYPIAHVYQVPKADVAAISIELPDGAGVKSR